MSLATRCTACGTIFRVVQDQLRVSEGWVRCGRCAEVFDARQQLFDVEREAPPPWPAQGAQEPAAIVERAMHQPSGPALHEAAQVAAQEVAEAEESSEHVSLPSEDFAPSHAPEAEPEFEPAPVHAEPRWVDEAPAHAPIYADAPSPAEAPTEHPPITAVDLPLDDRPDVVLAPSLQPRGKAKKANNKPAPKPAQPAAAPVPSFMRRAESRERWRRPGVRIALGASSLVLMLLLGGQMALHFRDALAAAYPPAKPLLQSFCQAAGCEIKPWRHIDGLSVENTALSQAGTAPNANQFQLTVALRNKSGVSLALPWIDLSLTDGAGAVVARRTLSPGDFRTERGASVGNAIAAGADVPMQVLLSTGSLKVSGYSVEIFHP